MERQKRRTHKEWRKIAKKLQRKRRRRLQAKQRDEEIAAECRGSVYLTKLAEEMALKLIEEENVRRQNEEENEKWMRSELLIEKQLREQQRKLDAQKKQEEAERNKIAAERSAELRKKLDLAEERARILAEKREREADLLRRIDAYVNGAQLMPEELNEKAESNPGKQSCQFFAKTATCRFGNKCVWNHCRPKISQTLLVHSFFTNIRLEQGRPNEYGTDLSLEFDEAQLFRDFCDFFDDVVPEFQKFGAIEQFVTCQNYEPHLRGHVYIEYASPRSALKAYRDMNGRYYATRMINIELCNIEWKTAICGLSLKNICPKGRNCSFLHIFKNPRNQFPIINALKKLPSTSSNLDVGANTTTVSKTESSWNGDGENDRRNWRWSESPDRDVAASKTIPKTVSSMKKCRKRSLSRDSMQSTKVARSCRSTRGESKQRIRHDSGGHGCESSHRSQSRPRKSRKRSRSRSERRKRSKESKKK